MNKLNELVSHGPSMMLRFGVVMLCGAALWLFLVVVATATEYSYYRLTPMSHFFQYDKLELVEPLVAGDPIRVKSTAAIHRAAAIFWDDALKCRKRPDGPFELIHIFLSNRFLEERPMKPRSWPYDLPANKALQKGWECKIDSASTAHLPFGIRKTQTISTPVVKVQG